MSAPPTVVIVPDARGKLALAELWQSRELLYFLVWRELKVRYKQTILGVLWALLQPLLSMVVFAVVFGRLARMPSDGIPYPIFAFAALVPWTYASTAVSGAASSLLGSQYLVTKLFFPKLLVPVAAVVSPLIDGAISFVLLLVMMIAYGIAPTPAVLALPLFVLLAVITTAALGIWLAALNVRYRDVRYAVPFVIQLWLFASPIAYPASLVPLPWRHLVGLNPLASVVEGFRWALLGGPAPGLMVLTSVIVAVSGLLMATRYFRQVEGTFADVI
jgi:lipopolysaccharide transport system permease protein